MLYVIKLAENAFVKTSDYLHAYDGAFRYLPEAVYSRYIPNKHKQTGVAHQKMQSGTIYREWLRLGRLTETIRNVLRAEVAWIFTLRANFRFMPLYARVRGLMARFAGAKARRI